jgi:hypothetical protein
VLQQGYRRPPYPGGWDGWIVGGPMGPMESGSIDIGPGFPPDSSSGFPTDAPSGDDFDTGGEF